MAGPAANGDWWYDKGTGRIFKTTNVLDKLYDEAKQNAFGSPVSFNTQADAQAYKAAYEAHKSNPASPNPSLTWWFNTVDCTVFHGTEGEMGSPWVAYATQAEAKAAAAHCNPIANAGKDIANTASSAISSLNPLGGLFQGNIWLRVAEVGLGVVLIVVGLVKLAPPSVKSAAKVAALL